MSGPLASVALLLACYIAFVAYSFWSGWRGRLSMRSYPLGDAYGDFVTISVAAVGL